MALCPLSEIVQVVSAYEGTGPEQLTIEPGQLIHVHKKSESGWWEGELQVCLAVAALFAAVISVYNYVSISQVSSNSVNIFIGIMLLN